MTISSPAFSQNDEIPKKYTCDGQNVSPPLGFEGVPENAKSLVLAFEDTDEEPIWVHWLVFDISPQTTEIGEGEVPNSSIEGLTSSKSSGYLGPCPKNFRGKHLLKWILYALDKTLDLPKESDLGIVTQSMAEHIIANATLVLECTSEEDDESAQVQF